MAAIQSVMGPLEPAELGLTLVHEHLIVMPDVVALQWPYLFDMDKYVEIAFGKVRIAMQRGVRTVFDPTVGGLGRDIRFLERVANLTGLQLIAATGYYTFDALPPYLATIDRMVDAFTHDIEVGIQGSQSRAGFLKCSTDQEGVTPNIEKLLRATARTHRRTGVPIMTHSYHANRSGLQQLDVFEDEGVDPRHVLIGHCGDSEDIEYLESIAERGAYLGMDRYGIPSVRSGPGLSTERRNATVAELCRLGYGEQLMLSQDSVACYVPPPSDPDFWESWGLTYIFDNVLPALEVLGVGERMTGVMLTDSVCKWAEPCAPY